MNATNYQILTNKKQICNEKKSCKYRCQYLQDFLYCPDECFVSQDVLLLRQHCHSDVVVDLVKLLHEVADILRCEGLNNLLVV